MSKQDTTSKHSEEPQETRKRIISAAARVLAEKGYDATTLREISREADAAPGLVHYYFGGKDQLLVEVLKSMGELHMQEGRELLKNVTPERFMEVAFALSATRLAEQPEAYRLRYELFSLGLHNARLSPGVRDLLAEGRDVIGQVVSWGQQLGAVSPSANRDALASLLLAVFDGLALQKMMDPTVDVDAVYQLLAQMIRGLPSDEK
ncbi:TetR/AcrR family transcriptional regulator [Ktedonosporobacter rubrisoli]|uniref:TetR/AcrR family transcriptional regulator n=1 Tax=Ktedonosporobacter rubrisoli TaxID=2509675 RepID=A0A4P6JSY9_KTERU|nr:TetR/AcrR family transcriptional regulator [Ktedonosporobacter rubrisoli]QBD78678.1 TetR/AcrR family transcriptional regulator [Ktedonosporobacter rubrisoli]